MTGDARAALDLADHVRAYRSGLHRRLRADHDYRTSRRLLAELLRDPLPAELSTLHALTLLSWGYRLPIPLAERLLRAAGASTVIRAGQLTGRQRRVLAGLLNGDDRTLRDAERGTDWPP